MVAVHVGLIAIGLIGVAALMGLIEKRERKRKEKDDLHREKLGE